MRNLQLDFFYGRYVRQGFGFFDNLSMTGSFLAQREERVNQGGQGNPLAAVTHDRERTTTTGFSFFLDKQLPYRNSFLFGGDIYHDKVGANSYNFEPRAGDPTTGTVSIVRPRVPDGSRYILAGLYVQDAFEPVQNRLRLSGALRYNVGSYRARAADALASGDSGVMVSARGIAPACDLSLVEISSVLGKLNTVDVERYYDTDRYHLKDIGM